MYMDGADNPATIVCDIITVVLISSMDSEFTIIDCHNPFPLLRKKIGGRTLVHVANASIYTLDFTRCSSFVGRVAIIELDFVKP